MTSITIEQSRNGPDHASGLGRLRLLALVAGMAVAVGTVTSVAHAQSPVAAAPAADTDGVDVTRTDSLADQQAYCTNVRDAALDAHARWQAAEILQMEEALRKRAAELEARQKELEAWLVKREAIARKAEETVVSIYGRMRADAAAVQLAAMTDDMAISILGKLAPRTASAILNEMEPARAAHLTTSVAGTLPTPTRTDRPNRGNGP